MQRGSQEFPNILKIKQALKCSWDTAQQELFLRYQDTNMADANSKGDMLKDSNFESNDDDMPHTP